MWGMTTGAMGGGESAASCGGRLVASDGRELVLRSAALRVDAGGGIARAVLEQRFANPYDQPLALVYQLALPADGAVAGFAFRVGERRIVGEVDRCESARRRYEDAILEGRTAALLEQDRSSLFTQEIGNVPPRAEVVAEITIDQRLRWLPDGSWEWRFPTVVAPRYLGEPGRVPDAGRVTIDVLDGPSPAALTLALGVRDALARGAAPSSPSHAIEPTREAEVHRVRFDEQGGAALDRDVVVRWRVATGSIGARLEVAHRGEGERAFGLLTLVPPKGAGDRHPIARDLVVLIDASGSMSGAPLEQARSVAQALVGSLGAADTLELIAFSSEPLRFRAHAERVTPTLRAAALEWLGKLQAGGATEMDRAVAAALAPLRTDAQRQVVLVTDGLIGFESEVVGHVLRALPDGSRLHTVGIGSAVNRSLTSAAARAGRGVEVIVGIGEDGGAAAERLLAQLAAPLVSELEVRGSAVRRSAPERLRDLAAGAPVLVSLELDPAGGELAIRGHGFERCIPVPPAAPGAGSPALATLFARERVGDLETRGCAGEQVDRQIEQLGLAFGIATRRTSWVAVSEEPTVDPRRPTRRVRIAQQLPHGLSVDRLGLLPTRIADVLREDRRAVTHAALPIDASYIESGDSVDDAIKVKHAAYSMNASYPPAQRARIVSLGHSELVVEIEVGDESLEWQPAAQAQLLFGASLAEIEQSVVERIRLEELRRHRGTSLLERAEVEVGVDLARSTAPGTVDPHGVIRLVLLLDAPLPERPAGLAIETAGEELHVELEG